MSENMHQLVVHKGPQEGQLFPLDQDVISIGRDPMSDIVLSDIEVSRQHARLTRTEAGYEIQDLGSTNGTFVNGKRLTGEPILLQDEATILLGSNVTLEYQTPEDPMATMLSPKGAFDFDEMAAEAEEAAPEAEEDTEFPEPAVEEPAAEMEISPPEEVPGTGPMAEEAPEPEPEAPEEPPAMEPFTFPPPPEEAPEEVEAEEEAEEEPLFGEEISPSPPVFDTGTGEETIIDSDAQFPSYDEPGSLPSFEQEPEPQPEEYPSWEPEPSFEPEPSPGAGELPSFEPQQEAGGAAPPPPPPAGAPPEEPDNRNRNIIIAVVVVLLLCCCCLVAAWFGGDYVVEFFNNLQF